MKSVVKKYNPKPITTVYRIAVFNKADQGVAEFETIPGKLLAERMTDSQYIADRIPDGYIVRVYDTVYKIGESSPKNKTIIWQ